jgi:ribosome-associated toxin RatA of RatAB toxin-antitoxin module
MIPNVIELDRKKVVSKEQEDFLAEDFSEEMEDGELDSSELPIDSASLQAVEIQTEKLQGRSRRIIASIDIDRPAPQVWEVLTAYEALADFIPNLAKSQLLPHPQGGIRLEQVGTQRLLRINFSARVVLDLEESFPDEIRFQIVEGDFKTFQGCWRLESLSAAPITRLSYILVVCPKRTLPVGIIEKRIRHDLPFNLLAVRQRVSELFPA